MDPIIDLLRANPIALAAAFVVDLVVGDPVYRAHPIRLVGASLQWVERRLRALGLDGYGGGIILFVVLAAGWLAVLLAGLLIAASGPVWVAWIAHVFVLYTMLALGDLVLHVRRIESAVRSGDLERARAAASAMVGRDTDRMDGAACRRAAVESLSENLTDGFVSPVFWYAVAGLPGVVIFKIVSTMDSMVGYKTPRHLRFGWCGARLDDVMNFVPARLTWLIIGGVACCLPGFSGSKAWRIGLAQHAALPGPNSGWSEAATAGGLERRIVGPIWLRGVMVADLWVGEPSDPELATSRDVTRAIVLTVASGAVATALALVTIAWV